ncbi:hypothetical protein [Streptococcus suis]|uniref:hypothetical protein n=1 Tax=Streptococcus suis TaxID=1307 RepID=UPI000769943E|nr:hypothetical protein [Streptococcus suis]CZA99240.1 Uncharacterised protein [Streptococcus suis]CZB06742.1 Uncharacterised protein [Streptococcus suis]CZB11547.1 Uncharacterised protein [Streptococcus suis]CZB12029.1 Uncharacterised protein [Streptococcus suis]
MRIAKNLFIKRPMKWPYILSIVLEIPIFTWFIRNIPQVLWQWGVMIGYIIISFIYYIINRCDMKYVFISVSDQLNKEYNLKFWKYFFNSLLTSAKYIFMVTFFQTMFPSLFKEFNILGIEISTYSFLLLVATYIILSRLLFDITRMPPVYLLSYVIVPLFIFSLVGIEKSLLSWTFASIILSSLIPQFLNEDIKILQTKNFIEIMNNTADNESKEKFTRLKYQVLLFIPFLYLALIISEVLIYNDEFNFLYNYLFNKHENILKVSYLSDLNMIVTVVKVMVVSFILFVFFEFKDIIIDKLSKFILIKVLKNEFKVHLYGKYYRVFFKNKKWQFDKSDYYWCIKNNFQSGNKEVYMYEEGIIKTKSGNSKNIKIVSEDILIIDDTYYLKSTSDVYKNLLQENKSIGYKLLKRSDYSVILFPLFLLAISIVGATLANNIMTNNFRGEYVFASVKNGSINNIDESKKIQFTNNEISINNQSYKVDNVTMQILDSNSEVVGSYSKQGILVFKDDSQNISYYILKPSQLFTNITTK